MLNLVLSANNGQPVIFYFNLYMVFIYLYFDRNIWFTYLRKVTTYINSMETLF